MKLNNDAYTMTPDNLIYDGRHTLDGDAVTIAIDEEAAGVIRRGSVLDIGDTGSYSLHAANGTPSVIVAEDTSYAASDTSVTVSVYTSGSFRKSALLTDVTLTAADEETLRSKGIFLK